MNSVHLIGRLTKDPKLQYGGTNKVPYCRFALAIDRGKTKDGEDAGADFPTVTAFGKTAENMNKYLEKGCLICVDASIKTDVYEKNGEKRYKNDLIANRVQFLQWKKPEKKEDAEATEEVEEIPKNFSKLTDDDIPF